MRSTKLLVTSLAVALAAGACKAKDAGTLTQDSALSRDLAMANKDTTVQPQLKDVPTTPPPATIPAPVATQPQPRTQPRVATPQPRTQPRTSSPPTTSAPAPLPTTTASGNTIERGARGTEGNLSTIPAGTNINLASNERVCTNTFKPGDRFTANVSESVSGANGAMIPAGAKAVLQVTSVKRSDNANDKGEIGLSVINISMNGKSYPVEATIANAQLESVRTSTKGDDAKKVIGGAVIGAIAGQIIGHNTKGTIIGAATGAAAGAATAAATGNYDFCIPSGGRLTIRLSSPATITTSN